MADYTPPEIALEQRKLERRRKMAELLSQQDPMQGQMVSGHYVGASPVQGIANLAKAYLGAKAGRNLDKEEAGLEDRKQKILADEISRYSSRRGGVNPGQNGVPLMMAPKSAKDVAVEAMLSRNPQVQGMGMMDYQNIGASETAAADRAHEMELQRIKDEADRAEKLDLEKIRSEDRQSALDARTQIAELASANKPQPTKSIQEIVDPLNPEQMIRVEYGVFNEDAYRNGDKTGVVGISGKEPVAAKREEKEGMGKETLRNTLDDLRSMYMQLDELKAISNTGRSAPSNAANYVATSGVGQGVGKMLGTDAQTIRDKIKSSRLQLLNAVKSATGMSAQQLNSNMELQTWLQAVTDPGQSYQTNIGIIDNLENAYLKNPQIEGAKNQAGVIGASAPTNVGRFKIEAVE